jgi:hypothetical protein
VRIDTSPTHPVVALGAVVLCLGALALTQIGCNQIFKLEPTTVAKANYYTCQFRCSTRVTTVGGPVFSLPVGGTVIDTVPAGSIGTILGGPEDHNSATWWRVQFDGRPDYGPGRGWVRQDALTVANETLITKPANTCLPAQFNPYLEGSSDPTTEDLEAACRDLSDEAQAIFNEKHKPLGRFLCQPGSAMVLQSNNYDASCEKRCENNAPNCLVAGTDPPDPTPEPLSAALFQPTSVCEVTGLVEISANGHRPKTQPTARGVVEIRGRPCSSGEECRVSMAYRLTGDAIEFDSGSIFASDPKFIDLALSGATEPDAINLGVLLPGVYLGEVPAGTAFSSGYVKRPFFGPIGTSYVISGRNTEGLALAINWTNKTCRVAGQLVSQVEGDDGEGTLDAQIDVALDGVIVNQPPQPNAGPDQTVECTSPTGVAVTLDASGSTDADNNIAMYVWRRGSATGSLLAAPSANPVTQTSQALGEATYHLQVVDSRVAADDDVVTVKVVDTTAPTISCNAPATITPSDVPEKRDEGISFKATATDACTGVSQVAITGFACTKPTSCRVRIQGDTITILDSGGIGDVISWTVAATDGARNSAQKTCALSVIKK